MTIIKLNNKEEYKWKVVFIAFSVAIVAVIVFCGFIYSKKVSLEHKIYAFEDIIREENVTNAELKKELFKITDPQMIEDIAEAKGLVKDNNPQWVFVSS